MAQQLQKGATESQQLALRVEQHLVSKSQRLHDGLGQIKENLDRSSGQREGELKQGIEGRFQRLDEQFHHLNQTWGRQYMRYGPDLKESLK